jgi:excisionase family DNA binding protein
LNADAPYLTAAQVAELLQVDETTVLRWALTDASMPRFKRGRVVRFPREALTAWLRRQEGVKAGRALAKGSQTPQTRPQTNPITQGITQAASSAAQVRARSATAF